MNLFDSSFLCLDIGTAVVRGIAHRVRSARIEKSAVFAVESYDTVFAIKSVVDELERQIGTHFDSAFVTGDFGRSFKFDMPVAKLVADRVQVTLLLAGVAFALIAAISLPLGLLAARRPGGVVDRIITVLTQITMSVPNFVLGIALMYFFALVLKWFQPEYVPLEQGLGPHLRFLVFPALAIALPKSAMTVKLLRGSILGELDQDYIRTAYSKGNSRAAVLRRHVLRNAMIPVVTFLAMAIGDIMAGSIVIEQVFGIPGLGRILISSIGNRDYPVVQAVVVLLAAVVVGCNFLADLLYRVMDPRIDGR